MNEEEKHFDYEGLGKKLLAYCRKYSIPPQHIFDILNDQKVIPMLRGKGLEYSLSLVLPTVLDAAAWQVNKLNRNAQPGIPDEDLEVIHKRTGIRLVVESKSAVRGSMTLGTRSRTHKVPHFKVKCHRSRSNKKLETNDRYAETAFDVLVSNPTNALYAGATIGEELELIDDAALIEALMQYYNAAGTSTLVEAAAADWRFVLPPRIAVDGFIPRTPVVLLTGDPNWQPLNQLETQLTAVVQQQADARRRPGHSSK